MKKALGTIAVFFGIFAFVALASASTGDVLQPASSVIYDENLIVNGTGIFDSIKVGKQGVGGVTFFNGTIINETTDENDKPVPVTIGDDVRIDGMIWRGATSGPGDSMPIKLNDDVSVYGNLTVTGSTTLNSDLTVSGKTIVNELTGPNGVGLPVAYGICDDDGSTLGGTSNVVCSWNAGTHRYEIAIEGIDYYYSDYVTIVTPIDDDCLPSVGSMMGKLLVYIEDPISSDTKQCGFNFVTF